VDAPDMALVVECKHDKKYEVGAMAKPTETFRRMVRKYRRRQVNLGWSWSVALIIKNKAGVWVALLSNTHNLGEVLIRKDVSAIVVEGIYFFKLEQSIAELKRTIIKIYKEYMEQLASGAGIKSKGVDRLDDVGEG
jgi:hypothetical protein